MIAHSYSIYGGGLDMINGPIQLLDLTRMGRTEDDLGDTMAWVRRSEQSES